MILMTLMDINKTISIIEKYISVAVSSPISIESVFDVDKNNMQILEQIIYASDGNMRRLVQLLDAALNECYKRCGGKKRLSLVDALAAIKKQARQMVQLFHGSDLDFLRTLTAVCKKRSAYRFMFPKKSPILLKYINKSSEYNILKIKEVGTGRRGTTYWFDYSYCVYADIPTHYQFNSERIARSRSNVEGDWITTVTRITDELLVQANLPGKVDGSIYYVNAQKTFGFISDGSRDDYFFMTGNIIESDRDAQLMCGRKVRFSPVTFNNTVSAYEIELL